MAGPAPLNIHRKEYKSFEISDFKAVGEGRFHATANAYGVLDSYREIVDPGCFKRSLDQQGPKRPLLWQHSTFDPIGSGLHAEMPNALTVDGKLNLKTQRGAECYELMKEGDINQMSIGYDVYRDYFDEEGNRHLAEARLYESSPVTFAANEMALVDAVKAYGYGQNDLHLVYYGLQSVLTSKAGRMFSAANRSAMESVVSILQELLAAQDDSESPKNLAVPPQPKNPQPAGKLSDQELTDLAEAVQAFRAAMK